MMKTFITDLLVIGSIMAFLHGLTSSKEYEAFAECKNYHEAYAACQGHNSRHLAKIIGKTELDNAKNASGYDDLKKYWTALQVFYSEGSTKWRWHDTEKPFSLRPEMQGVIHVRDAKSLVENGPIKVYCFFITSGTYLEIENCSRTLAYICEGSEVLSTSVTESKSTQIRPTEMSTTLMSEVTTTFTSKATDTTEIFAPKTSTTTFTSKATDTTEIFPSKTSTTTFISKATNTTEIFASKTSSITTHMPSSFSPTLPTSADEQVTDYLIKMKQLSVDDEDSLQIAVNETSSLLTYFNASSYHKTAPNLLTAVKQLETFSMKYAMEHLTTNGTSSSNITRTGKHFVMEVRSINAGHKKDVSFPSEDHRDHSGDGSEKIFLPADLFGKQETFLVGILYKDIHKLLPDESHSFLNGKKLKNTRLQTRIIVCSISPHSAPLPKNVTLSFTLVEPSKVDDTPHCVFWDFDIRSRFNGSWSNRGCTLVNKTNTKVVCSCNHLTNFAVLLQVGETKIPDRHQVALEVVTYIGCGLSLVGETLTVLAYIVLMNLKQEQCQIRLNLVIAIAVAQIIFLAGIDATSLPEACIFVAVSIHYFYLVGFAWMLMEGIYLYLMVVKVFNALVKMKLFYAFSWGFPLLMVVCSIVIASGTEDGVTSYVHSDYCWVSFSNNLVWTFAAPVLVVCLINSFILCRVVYEMTKMQGTKDTSNVKQGLKACAVLFPLLGMTWVFGILSVTDAGLVFQYIFTILNSLQGFFIFIMHVLRSTDVHTAYLRKRQKWENTKNSNFPSSRSVIENSSAWSLEKHAVEKHGMGNLRSSTESPDPMFRRHQISPINSDRMDTRESCLTPVNS